MDSKIVTLHAPFALTFDSQELVEHDLEPTRVLARTLYTAISPGTELGAYSGAPPLRQGVVYPRLVGYLNVAQILAVGSLVTGARAGEYILTTQSHRSAFVCDESEILVQLPKDADLASAAVTYLFHLPYSALLRVGIDPHQRAAVIGLGAIGLAAVALMRHLGYSVTGFTNLDDAAAQAARFGASVERKSSRISDTEKFDLIITTSNSWNDWALAMQLAGYHGKICVLGFPGRTEGAPTSNPLDTNFTYSKQLSLFWCGLPETDPAAPFSLKTNMQYLYSLVRADALPAKALISAHYPWQSIEEVYRKLLHQSEARLSCILEWK